MVPEFWTNTLTNSKGLVMFKFLGGLGVIGALLSLAITCAVIYTWFVGVCFGFAHGVVLGLVSIIPPVGFIEGILHLAGVI